MFVFGVFTAVYVEGQFRKLSFFPQSADFHERSTKDLAFLVPMNFPRGCKYLQGECAGKKNLVSVILWAIKNAFGRTGTREHTLTPAIRYGPFHLGGETYGPHSPTPETGIRLGRGARTALRQGGKAPRHLATVPQPDDP